MLQRLGTSLVDGRINNGKAGKQSADAKAKALAPTVRELQANGFDTLGTIARELNALEIPAPRGGKWHATSVKRLLRRLKRLDA
ncbi:MAG: recombinase family protein [Reyranella sp.]